MKPPPTVEYKGVEYMVIKRKNEPQKKVLLSIILVDQ